MTSPLGINLSRNASFSPQIAFTDIVKMGSAWESNIDAAFPQDVDGWVTELAPLQVVSMQMLMGINGQYAGGEYVCLYQGEGSVQFTGDAQVVGGSPGRLMLDVTPSNEGIRMVITRTEPSNHLRQIAIVPAQYEATYLTEHIFYPPFVERLKGFQCFRFAQWGVNNTAYYSGWEKRATPTYYSQATRRQVAIEYMVELANIAGVDLWINPPHQADETYLRGMARIIARQLQRGLTCFVEPSHEIFNNNLPQSHYAQQQGTELGLKVGEKFNSHTSRYLWYTRFSRQVFKLFAEEFSAAGEGHPELIRVLGSMVGNPWVTKTMLEFEDTAQHVDAIALGVYLGSSMGKPENADLVSKLSPVQVLMQLSEQVKDVMRNVADHVDYALPFDIAVMAYGAGQHLGAEGAAQANPTLVNLFVDANRHSGMGDIYTELLTSWAEVTNDGLMVLSENVAIPSQQGAMGLLEYQMQPITESPKLQAVHDYMASEFLMDQLVLDQDNQHRAVCQQKSEIDALTAGQQIAISISECYSRLSHLDATISAAMQRKADVYGELAELYENDPISSLVANAIGKN